MPKQNLEPDKINLYNFKTAHQHKFNDFKKDGDKIKKLVVQEERNPRARTKNTNGITPFSPAKTLNGKTPFSPAKTLNRITPFSPEKTLTLNRKTAFSPSKNINGTMSYNPANTLTLKTTQNGKTPFSPAKTLNSKTPFSPAKTLNSKSPFPLLKTLNRTTPFSPLKKFEYTLSPRMSPLRRTTLASQDIQDSVENLPQNPIKIKRICTYKFIYYLVSPFTIRRFHKEYKPKSELKLELDNSILISSIYF